MLDETMKFLGLMTFVWIFMISAACFCGWLMGFRFAYWKARLLGLAFAASMFLPNLVPGTFWYGVAGMVGVAGLVLILKPDHDEAS